MKVTKVPDGAGWYLEKDEETQVTRNTLADAHTLDALAREVNDLARAKGFYGHNDYMWICQKLLLIVSECIEAMDVMRKQPGDDVSVPAILEELADIIIRTLDLAQELCDWYTDTHKTTISFADSILQKHEKNKTRPHRHDRNF